MGFRIVSATLAVALSMATAAAQAIDQPAVADAVARSITTYSRLTIFDDVTGRVDDGTVTLRGKVTMPFKREDIGRRVAAIDGVRAVRNEIEVLPASSGDEALRRRIARAIYGNPAFWRSAAMPHPPIHILVENGRVTLTGVVLNETDRALARSLASGHGESSVTCALRTGQEGKLQTPDLKLQN